MAAMQNSSFSNSSFLNSSFSNSKSFNLACIGVPDSVATLVRSATGMATVAHVDENTRGIVLGRNDTSVLEQYGGLARDGGLAIFGIGPGMQAMLQAERGIVAAPSENPPQPDRSKNPDALSDSGVRVVGPWSGVFEGAPQTFRATRVYPDHTPQHIPGAFAITARSDATHEVLAMHHKQRQWVATRFLPGPGMLRNFARIVANALDHARAAPERWTKDMKHAHSRTQAQKDAWKGRNEARRKLVSMGLLQKKGDPREVHHWNRNPLDNRLENLAAVDPCIHRALHGGKCKQRDVEREKKFPSFGFKKDQK